MDLTSLGLQPHNTNSVKIGDKYARLTVVQIGKISAKKKYVAVCKCDCGAFPVLALINLMKLGRKKSCGCAQLDAVTKHGQHKNPLYIKWKGMHRRCSSPKDSHYKNYGGRGIQVCERWTELSNFIEDMQPTYFEGAEIDRINPDGNYEPSNCRWLTRDMQAANKTTNIMLTYQGTTQTLQAWANDTGIAYGTLWERIKVLKWDVERTLTTRPLDADTRCQIARKAAGKSS